MTTPIRNALIATAFMLLTAVLARAMVPTHHLSEAWGKLDPEKIIPAQFGDWHIDPRSSAVIVNPEVAATLNKIYTRILSRNYINSRGEWVMLSIAYGEDQRDENQAHIPDVCYPAQGFQVLAKQDQNMSVRGRDIPVRRLQTALNTSRYEPLTYWTMVGDHPTLRSVDKKLAEMRYTLRGTIPDGLLFRVSSIGRDTDAAYKLQERFVDDLFAALSPQARLRLGGVEH